VTGAPGDHVVRLRHQALFANDQARINQSATRNAL
jgi:hypothetical protein